MARTPLRLLASLALPVLVLVAGCAARRFPYPEAPRVSESHLRDLREMAEGDLRCEEDALTMSPDSSRLFHVEGCGRASDYLLLCAYGHCRFREVGSLRARAAFDLACEEDIETIPLGGNAWGVAGCGRRTTYVAACGAGAHCAWVPASALPVVDAVEGVAPSGPVEAPVEAPAEPIAPPAPTAPSAPPPPAPAEEGPGG